MMAKVISFVPLSLMLSLFLFCVGCSGGFQAANSATQAVSATASEASVASVPETTTVGANIAGTGALNVTAGGQNQNLTLAGSGTGDVLLKANVGIGTTTANANLSFGNSVAMNKVYLYDGGGAGAHGFGVSSNTLNIFADATATTSATIALGKYDKTTFTNWMSLVNGKVGINTTAPGSELDVNGTLRLTQVCDRAGANCMTPSVATAAAAANLATITAHGASTAVATTFSGGLNASTLNSSGEIIGTMASGSGQARWVSGNYGLIQRNDGTNFYMLLTDSGSPYGVWNNLRPLTINDSTGNVIMGSNVNIGGTLSVAGALSAPSFTGNVTGNLSGTATNATSAVNATNANYATSAGTAGALNSGGDNVSTTGWYRSNGNVGWYSNTYGGGLYMTDNSWLRTYGGKSLYVQGGSLAVDGKIGIGTTAPSATLSVVGNATFTQNVVAPTFTMTSDSRLKQQVEPLPSELQNIVALQPVHFFWNDLAQARGIKDSTEQVGFLAQQVEKIFPEVVRTGSDGYKSVNYAGLISPVVQALKEFYAESQADKLKTQEQLQKKDAQIADLEARLEKIEKQLNSRAPAGK